MAQFMVLWTNSRRRRGSRAHKVADFMPVWPLAVPARPTTAQLTAKLEAWLGIHQAAEEARRARAGPSAEQRGAGAAPG